MREEQIRHAIDSAAEELSPFFHMTAEELEKILMVAITLDMLGVDFPAMMGAVCSADGAENIKLCHEFASFTTMSESGQPETTTP